uniref:Uncharacterized protein n=1 Tax=Oryza punctata TaxID=4537 RepID=A0A0E0KNX3_ORYPU
MLSLAMQTVDIVWVKLGSLCSDESKSFECAVLPVKKLCHRVLPNYHGTSCIKYGSDDQFFPKEAQEGEEFYGTGVSICSQALPVVFLSGLVYGSSVCRQCVWPVGP